MNNRSEITPEIRESLVSRRYQLGWTHKDCASYFGVDISTYRNWESGKTRLLMSDRRWELLLAFTGRASSPGTPLPLPLSVAESNRAELENCLSMVSKIYSLLSSDPSQLSDYAASLKRALSQTISRYLDEDACALEGHA